MGILERIEAMLKQLLEAGSSDIPLASQAGFPDATDTPIPDATSVPTPTPVETEAATGAELDSKGMPWDVRIHGKAKKQNKDGTWRKIKGVDKSLVDEVEAETNDKVNSAVDNQAAKSGGSPVPKPKSVTPDIHKKVKAETIKQVNRITNEFKVDYDRVIELLNRFNAKSFNDLDPKNYEAVRLEIQTWGDWLLTCSNSVNKIIELGGEDGQNGVNTVFEQRGFSELNQCEPTDLPELDTALKSYVEMWQEHVAT